MLSLVQLAVRGIQQVVLWAKDHKTFHLLRVKTSQTWQQPDRISLKAGSRCPCGVREVCQNKDVCWSCGGLFKRNKATCGGGRCKDFLLVGHKGCGTSVAERQWYCCFISLDGWTNPGPREEVGGRGGRRDLGWKAVVRSLTSSAGQKIILCVLNYWCEGL